MKRTILRKISNRQRAKNARELPIKIEIIKRARGYCENCGARSSPLYPLSVHHKGIGADREEIKGVEDGEALCIKCHLGDRHKQKIILDSQPQWGRSK